MVLLTVSKSLEFIQNGLEFVNEKVNFHTTTCIQKHGLRRILLYVTTSAVAPSHDTIFQFLPPQTKEVTYYFEHKYYLIHVHNFSVSSTSPL